MSVKDLLSAKSIRFTHWLVVVMLLGLVLQNRTELAHAWQSPDAAKPAAQQAAPGKRVFPRVSLETGLELNYVGSVSADGKIRLLSKLGMFLESKHTEPPSTPPAVTTDDARKQEAAILESEDAIRKQVPPNIELHRHEQTVEDFQPPEHAVNVAKGHSAIGELRDSVVSFVYGANPVLVSPESVTTDSHHRVIVSDAGAHAVHVIAPNAKHSFQIVGGPGRRLQSPRGVAVDGDDNIYVSDSERGEILVYDSEGEFVRTIGTYGDEGIFESPSGIAIDGKAGTLYVVDPPRHTLFILDLKGYVQASIGPKVNGFSTRTGSSEPGGFQYPQSVLVHNDELVVVDSTRVHILTLQGKFLKEFKIANSADWRAGLVPGLFMDAENHIYVSDPGSGTVREYNHDGKLLGAFGRPGVGMGEFIAPSGMWTDSTGRVYIADAHRIQIFQLSGTK
jgi:DNA-binding beta-propeller fold protein YncE